MSNINENMQAMMEQQDTGIDTKPAEQLLNEVADLLDSQDEALRKARLLIKNLAAQNEELCNLIEEQRMSAYEQHVRNIANVLGSYTDEIIDAEQACMMIFDLVMSSDLFD